MPFFIRPMKILICSLAPFVNKICHSVDSLTVLYQPGIKCLYGVCCQFYLDKAHCNSSMSVCKLFNSILFKVFPYSFQGNYSTMTWL